MYIKCIIIPQQPDPIQEQDRQHPKNLLFLTDERVLRASGFIGGFLVEEALRRGYETWAGIRAGSSKAHLQDKRIHFIDLKYGDQEALTAQLLRLVPVSMGHGIM